MVLSAGHDFVGLSFTVAVDPKKKPSKVTVPETVDRGIKWRANRRVDCNPVELPEFGLELSWAMCRNAMCKNFGKLFRGHIPEGLRQTTDSRYVLSIAYQKNRLPYAQLRCRNCLQTSRLHSNQAIRDIARYYLSLSLPFADCENPDCPNHGINVYEKWAPARSNLPRYYRRQSGEHQVCCAQCGAPKKLRERAELRRRTGIRPEYSPYINLGEARGSKEDNRQLRRLWQEIINGVRAKRSVNDSYEIIDGITMSGYYSQLNRIGVRLRDYQSYRNARLLRRDPRLRQDEPIRAYTDVLVVSLQAFEKDLHFQHLKYVVTVVPVYGTLFVLAAHPNFLPGSFRRVGMEEREKDALAPTLAFEKKWDCLHTEYDSINPTLGSDPSEAAIAALGRGGFFIKSPYMEIAHFLVVQKMLSRFTAIYNYMDSAKDLFLPAMVAYRERILAGCPDSASRPARPGRPSAPKTAEVVLFQHKKDTRRTKKRSISANALWQPITEIEEPDEPHELDKRDTQDNPERIPDPFTEMEEPDEPHKLHKADTEDDPDWLLDRINRIRNDAKALRAKRSKDVGALRRGRDDTVAKLDAHRDKRKVAKLKSECDATIASLNSEFDAKIDALNRKMAKLKGTLKQRLTEKQQWRERQLKPVLRRAWDAAEKRFNTQVDASQPLKLKPSDEHERMVKSQLYRLAMLGAKHKNGNWVWMHYPPESDAYEAPRTHWLTRTPGKTFEKHGESVLLHATLQPVDSIFNSMRTRIRAVHRPALRADGRSFAESYVLPSNVHNEVLIYLAGRNYSKRRKRVRKQTFMPAFAMGLAGSQEDENKLDYLKQAWEFQLAVHHAKGISAWLRR